MAPACSQLSVLSWGCNKDTCSDVSWQHCNGHTSLCQENPFIGFAPPPQHSLHCRFRTPVRTNATKTSGPRRRRVTASQSSSSLAPRKQASFSPLGPCPPRPAVSATEFWEPPCPGSTPECSSPSFPGNESEVGMNRNCLSCREVGRG